MDSEIKKLIDLSNDIRFKIIRNSHLYGIPHLGSCLSCTDLLVLLYWRILDIYPSNPLNPIRDRFILSKGHSFPVLLQVLIDRGFLSFTELDNLGKDGSFLGEHPPIPDHLPGIEAATGSLGHGLPIGLGMALAGRIQNKKYNVYSILGDGECNEGSVWEAAMLAAALRVNNICVLIDFNKWQATGRSCEVMALDPLVDKWRAFGWNAVEVDGHSFEDLLSIFENFPNINGRPTAIIAHTIKGKGVSFMEDDNNWHYRIPSLEDVLKAKIELGVML